MRFMIHCVGAWVAAIISYVLAIAFLGGFAEAVNMPTVYSSPALVTLFVYCAVFVPFIVASFFGIIFMPKTYRHMGSVVMPMSVYLSVNYWIASSGSSLKLNPNVLIPSFLACLLVGAIFRAGWRPQFGRRKPLFTSSASK